MLTWPPRDCARSRIPRIPYDDAATTWESSIPTPLSATLKWSFPPHFRREIFTAVAFECRATFVSASWKILKTAAALFFSIMRLLPPAFKVHVIPERFW